MPDPAQINRSLSNLRTELEYLRDSGVLSPPQFESITAQLPKQNGTPSSYVDPRYQEHGKDFDPSKIAQDAQDPSNPAHPGHPKHHDWAKGLAQRFGNAAIFGAGASIGSDIVNGMVNRF